MAVAALAGVAALLAGLAARRAEMRAVRAGDARLRDFGAAMNGAVAELAVLARQQSTALIEVREYAGQSNRLATRMNAASADAESRLRAGVQRAEQMLAEGAESWRRLDSVVPPLERLGEAAPGTLAALRDLVETPPPMPPDASELVAAIEAAVAALRQSETMVAALPDIGAKLSETAARLQDLAARPEPADDTTGEGETRDDAALGGLLAALMQTAASLSEQTEAAAAERQRIARAAEQLQRLIGLAEAAATRAYQACNALPARSGPDLAPAVRHVADAARRVAQAAVAQDVAGERVLHAAHTVKAALAASSRRAGRV